MRCYARLVLSIVVVLALPARAEGPEERSCKKVDFDSAWCGAGLLLFGSAGFRGQYGEVDASGRSGSFSEPIPAVFDQEQQLGSYTVGWFGKPILRDALIATQGVRVYEKQHWMLKTMIFRAVTVDLNYGYSRKFDLNELEEDSADKLKYSNDFTVTVQYKLPLDELLLGGAYKEK